MHNRSVPKNKSQDCQRRATIGNAERPCHPDASVTTLMINVTDIAEYSLTN